MNKKLSESEILSKPQTDRCSLTNFFSQGYSNVFNNYVTEGRNCEKICFTQFSSFINSVKLSKYHL